jgi:hypothetical protein
MYVEGQTVANLLFFVKFRNSKFHNVLDITPVFLKLCFFTNVDKVFPVVVFLILTNFQKGSMLHGHSTNTSLANIKN